MIILLRLALAAWFWTSCFLTAKKNNQPPSEGLTYHSTRNTSSSSAATANPLPSATSAATASAIASAASSSLEMTILPPVALSHTKTIVNFDGSVSIYRDGVEVNGRSTPYSNGYQGGPQVSNASSPNLSPRPTSSSSSPVPHSSSSSALAKAREKAKRDALKGTLPAVSVCLHVLCVFVSIHPGFPIPMAKRHKALDSSTLYDRD